MSGEIRVLITGGTGLLGKALLETSPEGLEVRGTYYQNPPPVEWARWFTPLDLQQPSSVESAFQWARPTLVIHTASVGSVDEAERFPEQVRRINVEGTRRIGEACRLSGSGLIYISSNAVFDGDHPPYSEESKTHAVNQYGRFKIEAEQWVSGSGLDPLIVRPILLYGWPFPGGRSNAVTRWLNHLEKGEPVQVAEDLISMPLRAVDCAQALWEAVRRRCRGVLHLAGPEKVSLAEFARETARIFGCEEGLVHPVPNRQLGLAAARPRDTSFLLDRMKKELGLTPMGPHEGLNWMYKSRALVH